MELLKDIGTGVIVVHIGAEPMADCNRMQSDGTCKALEDGCKECMRTILQKYMEATQ